MFINHYEILGVEPNADLVQITAAWKRLLKKYHPDLNQDDQDATEQTILINKAFEILSDSRKRKRFDQQLEEYEKGVDAQEDLDQAPFQPESDPEQNAAEPTFGPNTFGSQRSSETQRSAEPQRGSEPSFNQPTFGDQSSESFSSSTRGKSQRQRYALVMSIVGIGLGALTAIPIGLFLVWTISGFDPLGIFREKPNETVAEGDDTEKKGNADKDSKNSGNTKPSDDKDPETNKITVTKAPEKITISYAKFGESRQTVRVEKFVEEVANKEGIITPITTPGLKTSNPVGRFRALLRVTYQINGEKTGTLTFKNGEEVNIREAILKHAKKNARPFEKIEITYALFGKQRNKVRCEEQIAAVASQIDTVVPITTHGLSLRNPSGIVRQTLDIKYKVAGKTGEITLRYGQNVDLRKTILEHANVLDGSYTPSLTKTDTVSPKSDTVPPKSDTVKKGPEKAGGPPAKQVAKADPKKEEAPKAGDSKQPDTSTRLPVPPENEVAAAKAKLAEVFKTDYEFAKRATGTEELSLLTTLAAEVIKLADKEKDPVTLFAIYEIAIDISLESCHERWCFEYVHEMELRFNVDGLTKRAELLSTLRRELPLAYRDKNRVRAVSLFLSRASKGLLKQAVHEKRWQVAIDIADAYRGFCTIQGEKEKATVLKQATNLLKRRLNTSIKVGRYLQEFDVDSIDIEKALAVGNYLCFTTQQWDKGMKFLAKCSDSKLAGIASSDLASNESNYLLVGDLWWDLALDEDYYDYRLPILSRAKYFYWLALDKSTGIDRTKIDKRIKDANKAIWGDGFFFDSLNSFESPSSGIKLIQVRNGSFDMGEHKKNIDAFGKSAHLYQHEGPRHTVTISKTYYLGQYEVTTAQWTKVMGTRPWLVDRIVGRDATHPAVYVSWNDAQEFCKRLSEMDKRKYRLPTEAEWEYACRAGTITRYHSGDGDGTVFPHDWMRETAYNIGYRSGLRVGTKLPNPFGFYDMNGNQFEWCEDSYEADFYSRSPKVNPVNRAKTDWKVCRGGNIYHNVWKGRSASRHKAGLNERTRHISFRIVMEK